MPKANHYYNPHMRGTGGRKRTVDRRVNIREYNYCPECGKANRDGNYCPECIPDDPYHGQKVTSAGGDI